MRERFQPNALVQQLKRYGPEWLEQMPQLPQLVLDFLEHPRYPAAPVNSPSANGQEQKQARKKHRVWLGAAMLGGGLGMAFPQWEQTLAQIPVTSLLLAGLGALLLLIR